jgi:predicted dehydrogenase
MGALRYGLVGAGFITRFQLRALEQVRGVEVAGLCSRTAPDALAREVRERGLGEARVYGDVAALARDVDVVALFGPNFTRVPAMEAIARAAREGARLRGLICEKPLGRNLPEARRMLELADAVGAPTAYFENQVHMKMLQAARAQLAPLAKRMGPPVLARSSEEHAGPHAAWFWDPQQQGGGVMSDMGCHCLAVGRQALTPPDRPPDFLKPVSVQANLALLQWGRPEARASLRERFGVDYARTPAEDFATGIVTYANPESGQLVQAQFTVSWMYEKQGLRLLIETLGPGYAFEANSLRSPLEIFIADRAAEALRDSEQALEKATASRGLLAVQPNEADLYGYTDEQVEAAAAFASGRSALLDWRYGCEIVRLTMAAYLSAERRASVDLTDRATDALLERFIPLIQQGRGRELLAVSP